MRKLALGSMLLAMVAAAVYILTGLGVLNVPGLESDPPAAIPFVCAGGYILGGLLILTAKRWLLIVGAGINLMVMGFFFVIYNQNTDVMFSVPGLATKIAQILLEFGLIAIIVQNKPRAISSF